MRRIFAEYLAGRGIYAIAEGLTRDKIPSPSQADPARNPHRTGEGWAKSAIKAILANPRYTGRQVWNKQRKDEVLLDVANVADGYETKMRWNDKNSWVWSEMPPRAIPSPLPRPRPKRISTRTTVGLWCVSEGGLEPPRPVKGTSTSS